MLQVKLIKDSKTLDERQIKFGCRTFEIDSEKGFLLNGESYPLRGVSRHQDRPGIGNALLPEHHREDMELIRQIKQRPYLWATHVWNMFDFAADARDEGGEAGMNHKGLVTFDRTYRKDSFYAYKAWLSKEPFVHLCSKRYVNRAEPETIVKVYSNQPEVELFINGKSYGIQKCEEHIFSFNVPNQGVSRIVAKAGEYMDECVIRRVEEPDESYHMPDIRV